ncbi:MAG: ankyrin repeat domain-containing protein [Rhabdochlamydiaceae bacterium]|nr:ankyrin repeat domain-containing protein [Rhabdochlamydiaceae bacterium]
MSINNTVNPIRTTQENSQVWIAYINKDHNALTQLAKDATADFGVLTTSTKKTIFHKIVLENADDRLKAITNGFVDGNCVNRSIPKAVNQLYQDKTPLYLAAESSYLSWIGSQKTMIELLISLGARQDIEYQGKMPIDVAPMGVRSAFKADLLTCLLNGEFDDALILLRKIRGSSIKDASGNILPPFKDSDENNYMLLAITKGKQYRKSENIILEIIRVLKDCGENINHLNKRRETVLGLAIVNGYRKIISSMILEPDLIWESDIPGGTIVHLAAQCQSKDVDILELLVNQKPECVNLRNRNGQTPLHLVSSIEAVTCLCTNGADSNAQDNQGKTPVQLAAIKEKKLADWMRLYEPKKTEVEIEEIKKKHSKNETLKGGISKIAADSLNAVGPALTKAAGVAIEAAGAALTASALAALKNNTGEKK